MKSIGRLKLFLEGKKKRLRAALEKGMIDASKKTDFERAEKLRRQIFALRHIRDTALISDSDNFHSDPQSPALNLRYRIEGYDISNTSGTSAVGSMVVFENGEPDRSEYRKFRIKTVFKPNDVGMLTEMLARRFRRALRGGGTRDGQSEKTDWRLPDLVLVDGGIAQANAAKKVLMRAGLRIPIIGISKGPARKRNDILGAIPKGVTKETLIKVRNEAHRFAVSYHKTLRARKVFS